jgi:cytochrome c oxidase subunit 4
VLLLGSTVSLSFVPLGWENTVIALFIAFAKATIVAVIFMELDKGKALVRIFALAGLLWLAIMFWFVLNDYATRSEFPPPVAARPALSDASDH